MKLLLHSMLLCTIVFSVESKKELYPMDTTLTEKKSPFTNLVIELSKRTFTNGQDCNQLPYPKFGFSTYYTEENPYYLSYKKVMRIKTTIDRAEKTIDDINYYKNIFKSFAKTEIKSKDQNKWLVAWEHIMPTFFIPNIVYQTIYVVDKTQPNIKKYRYQLKEANYIKYIDGLVSIETINPTEVCYTAYEFNEGEWGMLKAFISLEGVWKAGMKGNYVSDQILRLRIENPEWSVEKVLEEGEKIANKFDEDAFFKARKKFNTFNSVIKSIKD